MPDDYSSNLQTSGEVDVGSSVTGDIETRRDRDWFAVDLEAGTTYQIDLEGSPTEGGTLRDTYLRGIYTANGNRLSGTADDDAGAGRNSRVFFTPTEDGTYYVAAGAYGRGRGTYTLSVSEAANSSTDDFAAGTTGTRGAVAVGTPATGTIETAGDRDWFAVTLDAGRTYRIDLEGSLNGGGTLDDPYLYGIHDANGNLLSGTDDDDGGLGYNSQVSFTPTANGTYYVAAGAYGSGTGAYTLSVSEVAGVNDDFSAGTGTDGTVVVGGSVAGTIETRGDRDWFAVDLVAGRTYRIDLEGEDTGGGTLGDPYLHGVYDANGDRLYDTTDDDGGMDRSSRVEFTPTVNGTYYVAAGSAIISVPTGANSQQTGTYTLSVTDVTASITDDDFAAGTGTDGTVPVGGSVAGTIETRGDRDWFEVDLVADKIYRIDLKGLRTGDDTLRDPYLRGIHDADGDLISRTTDDDGGRGSNSRLFFAAPEDGTYYVAAGAYGNRTGAYTLSVAEAPDDFAAGTGTTGRAMVDVSVTGVIDPPRDRDWFAVDLVGGRTYRIDLKGGSRTGDRALYDPYLRGVYDEDGDFLPYTRDDNGGEGRNSRVEFTAPADGTYHVAAGASGNWTGAYTLSVRVPGDDFEAGTGTSGRVALRVYDGLFSGSAVGEIDYADDRDWFAVDLVAGKIYQIDLVGWLSLGASQGDPDVYGIHSPDGVLIPDTDIDNRVTTSRVNFLATEDATYYVAAGSELMVTRAYTLSVSEIVDDFSASTGTTGRVTVGGSVMGGIDYVDDRDWFAVDLDAGKTYRIDLEGSLNGAGTLADPHLHGIHTADGNLLSGTTNDNINSLDLNSRVRFTATEDATYYVAAGTDGAFTGTYTLSVEEVM